jgi:hypothetical protein
MSGIKGLGQTIHLHERTPSFISLNLNTSSITPRARDSTALRNQYLAPRVATNPNSTGATTTAPPARPRNPQELERSSAGPLLLGQASPATVGKTLQSPGRSDWISRGEGDVGTLIRLEPQI